MIGTSFIKELRDLRKHIWSPFKRGQFGHCVCLYCHKSVHSFVKQVQQSCNTRLKLTKILAIAQLLPKEKRQRKYD